MGDLFVEAAVETPVNLSKDQKSLLQQFAETESSKTSPKQQASLRR